MSRTASPLFALFLGLALCAFGAIPASAAMRTGVSESAPPASRETRDIFAVDVALLEAFSGDAPAQRFLRESAASSADLAVAEARVRQARASEAAASASLGPALDVTADASRTRASLRDPSRLGVPEFVPRTNDRFSLGLSGLWDLDLFGAARSTRRAATFRTAAAAAEERDVLIAWSRDMGIALLDYRLAQASIVHADAMVSIEARAHDVAVARASAGISSADEALRADAARRSAQRSLATAQAAAVEATVRLAALSGRAIGEVGSALGPLPEAHWGLRPDFPYRPGSENLRRRPDVRAAEFVLKATDAELSASTLRRFPSLTLSGSLGWIAATAGDIGRPAGLSSAIAPAFQWSLFDRGARSADRALKAAQQSEALALYVDVVNRALAESAGFALHMEREQSGLASAGRQAEAEERRLGLVDRRFGAGLQDVGDVIAASREAVLARQAVDNATHAVGVAQLQLHAALGGDSMPEG
jgi:outer membrane protein TolC